MIQYLPTVYRLPHRIYTITLGRLYQPRSLSPSLLSMRRMSSLFARRRSRCRITRQTATHHARGGAAAVYRR